MFISVGEGEVVEVEVVAQYQRCQFERLLEVEEEGVRLLMLEEVEVEVEVPLLILEEVEEEGVLLLILGEVEEEEVNLLQQEEVAAGRRHLTERLAVEGEVGGEMWVRSWMVGEGGG